MPKRKGGEGADDVDISTSKDMIGGAEYTTESRYYSDDPNPFGSGATYKYDPKTQKTYKSESRSLGASPSGFTDYKEVEAGKPTQMKYYGKGRKAHGS